MPDIWTDNGKRQYELVSYPCDCGCGEVAYRGLPGKPGPHYRSESHQPGWNDQDLHWKAVQERSAQRRDTMMARVETLLLDGKLPREIYDIVLRERLMTSRGKRPSWGTVKALCVKLRRKSAAAPLERLGTADYQIEREIGIPMERPVIEKGVEIPPTKSGKGGAWKELAAQMEPGDSVLLEKKGAHNLSTQIRERGMRAVLRRTEDGKYRVWCMAAESKPAPETTPVDEATP